MNAFLIQTPIAAGAWDLQANIVTTQPRPDIAQTYTMATKTHTNLNPVRHTVSAGETARKESWPYLTHLSQSDQRSWMQTCLVLDFLQASYGLHP